MRIPDLQRVLIDAARRQERHARRSHRIGRRPLAVIAVLVVGSATATLAAAGVFRSGSPVSPGAPVVATQDNGAAIARTARLLPLRVADPGGGLPWGVRVIHTTRDETCLQLGRVAFGTVGVLGQDGAFANDGLFHPLSENYEGPLSCGTVDAHGNAFLSLALPNVPASATDRGCQLGSGTQSGLPANRAHVGVCPARDLREVFYGLIGPDATSITYATPSGRLVKTSTVGSDGAYLIVLPYVAGAGPCGPHRPICPDGEMRQTGGSDIGDEYGAIRAVRYRDGGTCRIALPGPGAPPAGEQSSCPAVGYVAASTTPLTTTQVDGPITVHTVYSTVYCGDGRTFEACSGGRVPHGYHRLNDQPPSLLVTVSFVSRVAITNSRSYYYFDFQNPGPEAPGEPSICDRNDGQFGGTYSDYRIGQRVEDTQFVPACRGVVQGSVTLVTDTSPTIPAPQAPTNASRNLIVGDFTINDTVKVTASAWRRTEALERQFQQRACARLRARGYTPMPQFCAHK
jgi:hypothetical protein